ncbi:unnamed protein product, partial [marine sediment metagenome]
MGQIQATTSEIDDRLAEVGNFAYSYPSIPTLLVGQTYKRIEATWNDAYTKGFRVESGNLFYYDYYRDLEIIAKADASVTCSVPNTTVFMAAYTNGVIVLGIGNLNLVQTAGE